MKLPKNTNRLNQTDKVGAAKQFEVGQALAFAQAVLARYGGQYRPVSPLSLDWLHTRLNITLFQTDRSTSIYFAPRLTLTLAVQGQLSPAKVSATVDSGVTAQPEKGRLQELIYKTMEAQTAEAEEPSVRPKRTEMVGSVPMQAEQKSILLERASLHPVPRVFHRQPVPQLPVEAGDPIRQSLRPPPSAFPTPTNAPTMRGGSGVNIQQLTDDVIQAIDRRIIAQRERMGRL